MGGSVGTIVGTGVGAIAGVYMGNPWLGAQMGAAIGGGLDARSASRGNARASRTAAQYNYQSTINTARFNNRVASAAAGANAAITMAGASATAGITQQISVYNASLKRAVANHNASLLEDEAERIYEASELDVDQFIRAADQQQGGMKVAYGASGVQLDAPGDTPATRLLDAEIEEELEVSIIRHNADLQASKLLLGAATSQWEGELAARQILFEGFSSANMNLMSAASSAFGGLAQTALDNTARSYNARVRANDALYTGGVNARQFDKQGDQALMNGIFGAGMAYAGTRAGVSGSRPTSSSGGGTVAPMTRQYQGPHSSRSLLID